MTDAPKVISKLQAIDYRMAELPVPVRTRLGWKSKDSARLLDTLPVGQLAFAIGLPVAMLRTRHKPSQPSSLATSLRQRIARAARGPR